ncbi:CDP-glycerol glycerophosphotransferase family protein [Phocicoccus pinnipedialis]|uniref:CDP-Glycerol:Poly(Glycerophosphate) glycerophosphotransferase n=1 Tax=Phocicoccus pinnipedialis TaxID=110845 RepID=A0A6V7R861_9BACL|nr:CDP-glycerol glycerophosphotransferase family protein [Jeotgalicoccus pinnipedialis]MBP1938957.1 CDP-glycerol glycerophosphotransferase (TagB/SpsB family) [Jeotgalicoccus pinnipedialis]CAD2073204.1 hypothetical protein JEOPIN946_00588 [Jeotgalicoccus pinnipedialis]
MKKMLHKFAKYLSSNFAGYFPKSFRKKFRRSISVVHLEKIEESIYVTYEIEPHINVRFYSDYHAFLITKDNSYKLSTKKNDLLITVKIPLNYLEEYTDGFTIQLKSNDEKMNVKRQINNENNITRFIFNEKLYKVFTSRAVQISSVYQKLRFPDEYEVKDRTVYCNYVKHKNQTLYLNIEDTHINDIDNIYALYAHKFVKVFDVKKIDNDISISNLDQFTKGKFKLYAQKGECMYNIIANTDIKQIFETKEHRFELNNEIKYLEFTVIEHIIHLDELIIEYIGNNKACMVLKHQNIEDMLGKNLLITDVVSNHIKEVLPISSGEYMIEIDDLIERFSRKKLMLQDEEKIYQIKLDRTELDNSLDEEYNYLGEILRVKFYKRIDGYLGFTMKRPKIKRLIKNIDGLILEGYINGNQKFKNLQQSMILIDRNSEQEYILPIEDEFKLSLDPHELINIMSQDKTIIDIYIGYVNDIGEVIRKTKIEYQHSDYKKDTYYSHVSIENMDGDYVNFLVTTTPFNNLKIETFVVPKEIDADKFKRNPNIWLVGERRDTAQENGLAMFEFLRNQTNESVYYVIDEFSKDYEKIKHGENVLKFGSLEHYEISLQAGVLLCTHDFENILPYKPAKGFFDYENTFKVFLQHGVLGRKPVEYHKFYYEDPFDLFIVSSDSEKKDIVMDIMQYESEDIVVTGLARFDYLPFDNLTKDILLMPTWRDWLNNEEVFEASDYFHRYKSLLTNERLNNILEVNDIRLNFYPHYRAQSLFNSKNLKTGPNIDFIELGEESVQELLINHSLLVTDFSSVSFDFLLMNKPVIYYHFDDDKFFRKGLLRPIEETFVGDIAGSEEELVDLIHEAIQNKFVNSVENLDRILKYRDHNNRKRIYESIKSMM